MIVDDHEIIRTSFERLFSDHTEYEIVGVVTSRDVALAQCFALEPDVVILGMTVDSVGLLSLIEKILELHYAPRIVVVSMYDTKHYALRALGLGVLGYLSFKNVVDEILPCVSTVLSGDVYLSQNLLTTLSINDVFGMKNQIKLLNTNEFEVFKLLAEGNELNSISQSLGISLKTVQNIQSIIKQKLNISNLAELVAYAVREGVVSF